MKIVRIGIRRENGDFIPHSHEAAEILYITKGPGKVVLNGKEQLVNEGDIVYIPPEYKHTGPGGLTCGVIYIIAFANFPAVFKEPFIIADNHKRNIRTYFEDAGKIYMSAEGSAFSEGVVGVLCDLIFEIVFELRADETTDEEVILLRQRILNGYSESGFNLGEEMKRIFPSVTYLRRRFVRETGITPSRYLISLRMEQAKRLLGQKKHTGMSIGQIAAQCGYEDEHYFIRQFKKECSMTPGEYYRKIK